MDDVESLERATIAAVPPRAQEEMAGWLLALDTGTVGRARSAVPLRHEPAVAGMPRLIEARYRAHGLPPEFRVARLDCFRGLQQELAAMGYSACKPTLVQVSAIDRFTAFRSHAQVTVAADPPDGWSGVFLGEGFDPVDGASRMGILRRSRDSVYAAVRIDGQVRAVGTACFSHGWCGIHGMRTLPSHRGQGLASGILAAFAREAASRGVARAYLQVEEGNEGAQSLYRQGGFATAWTYEYWKA
ncbi:MAG: GNAT family N-acetyltransferase [Burkholderiales bacterium]|nr:GNAT family N-acetyltransferase [Burkholderiales bacterium]